MAKSDRRYFIVKHGLDAFEALPNFIWRTGQKEEPASFKRVRLGDRWIAFAYAESDRREQQLSQITGFYECTHTSWHGNVPLDKAALDEMLCPETAWMIYGKPHGPQPKHPVGVPPIDDLLGRRHFKSVTLVPITAEEFDRIQHETLRREFDAKHIHLLGREPKNEQELLAIVVYGHKDLGIEEIIQVQKAFPDLLVRLKGCAHPVYLELETYSQGFFSHAHHKHVRRRRFKPDGKSVAVLCWIDNHPEVKDRVHKVYELQSLIREGRKILW